MAGWRASRRVTASAAASPATAPVGHRPAGAVCCLQTGTPDLIAARPGLPAGPARHRQKGTTDGRVRRSRRHHRASGRTDRRVRRPAGAAQRPVCALRPGSGPSARATVCRADPDRVHRPRARHGPRQSGRRHRTGRRGPVVRRRGGVADRGGRRARDQAGRPAHPARPGRRQGRHRGDQGGGGRRGVGTVRGRPAAHVPAVRRTPRLEGGGAVRLGIRSRRLQGRDGGGQGTRHTRTGGRGLGSAEVRGRRAPRPTGPGHRVPGPHPHVPPRASSSPPRPTRPSTPPSTPTICGSTCSAPPAPAVRA